MTPVSRRIFACLALSFFYILCSFIIETTSLKEWAMHSSATHTLIQSIASILAIFCGAAALFRFYSLKEAENESNMLLFLGVGFISTAIIDTYHTVVTASFFMAAFPHIPSSVAEWSWLATRAFLAVLGMLSLFSLFQGKQEQQVSHKSMFISISVTVILTLFVFTTIRIPYPIYPTTLIARPLEIIPGTLFIMTLMGYLMQGGWKTEKLTFWMVLFFITSAACQLFYIDLAPKAHDMMYLSAHVLKVMSYGMVYLAVSE